jgi:hypothetical protein
MCTFWVAEADLLDLYVQRMDETTRIQAYNWQQMKELQFLFRHRRSILESSFFRVANPVKQILDIGDKVRGTYLKNNLNDSKFRSFLYIIILITKLLVQLNIL